MPTIAAAQASVPNCARPSAFGAAARSFGARSPSGALLRHSRGRTHPPLAQLQFPRFLRPDLTGVTRFDLSQVYRAPRRPCRIAGRAVAPEPPGTKAKKIFSFWIYVQFFNILSYELSRMSFWKWEYYR